MPDYFDSEPLDGASQLDFLVQSQKVDLDIDFATYSITGSTLIVASPLRKELKSFRFNCRQCRITKATIEGKPATVSYTDPYRKVTFRRGSGTVHQHDYLRQKLEPHVKEPADPELILSLPERVRVRELDVEAAMTTFTNEPSLKRKESDTFGGLDTPTAVAAQELGPRYWPMRIYIEFTVKDFRDGLHAAGFEDGDSRYPHIFTKNSMFPGNTSSLFPCLDNVNSRHLWEISIRCPRTLGDAFRVAQLSNGEAASQGDNSSINKPGNDTAMTGAATDDCLISLSEEEKALDLNVVCTGEVTDDIVDPSDPARRSVSFALTKPVAARHVGFAIGPFEHIDLSSEFREAGEDDTLGTNARKVEAYCLPGRADELRNTCMPMTKAIDYLIMNYGGFPYGSYKLCFVDDLIHDCADAAGLTFCSNRLLFPEDIIEPLDANTRVLVNALASQWAGVHMIPQDPTDTWTITGIAGFMTDIFMKKLAGNNEYRFRQKLASDKVFELDIGRYSVHQLGGQLDIDPSELDFLRLKSSLILFILNNRLTKTSGSAGMSRIINKMFLAARTDDSGKFELTTEFFMRTCEKLGHTKLDAFFKQWVYGAGCPDFRVKQQFNKKKLVVEITIEQLQDRRDTRPQLHPSTFLREAKEQVAEAYAPDVQPVFTGPMTIRIHEADGTPYEHIVEIKEKLSKFEIPYNTKYKRLRRSKKTKERVMQNAPESSGENPDDALLYCLGDVLQSEEDVKEWHLADWDEIQERQMGDESYEWIRMDADFEWVGKINISNMPIYMFVSQLQQDRDVVAQYESLQRIHQQNPHPLGSTFLIRTLMDRRYFHGIRTNAAKGLTRLAVPELRHVGLIHLHKAFQELYCFPKSPMPRANDFSDRANYLVQCAIPKAMALVRDANGKCPLAVRRFLIDKIKFNDNSNNQMSDCFYIATLTRCLTESIASCSRPVNSFSTNVDKDDDQEEDQEEGRLKTEALNELERYRRIDEWIPSYQNTYTMNAIDCIELLINSQTLNNRVADILQYTRLGNADNVRLRAFEALIGLKLARKPQILKYILHSLSDDPSPHIRERLVRVLGQALGSIAIGDDQPQAAVPKDEDADGGIIMDEETPAVSRQIEVSRKTSPEGALNALKIDVADNEVLKSSLWQAAMSPLLSLSEVVALLDIAALLYESSSALETLVVNLRLPHTWRVEHVGKGKLRFYPASTIRTKPSKYAPLSPDMHKLVQDNGLKYNGPVSKEVKEKQILALKIAKAQQDIKKQEELQSQRAPPPPTHMSPPPVPTPAETGLKLSLGGLKRKQSVDAGRAASPKTIKTQKGQTSSGALSITVKARSPSMTRAPSTTPSSAGGAKNVKHGKNKAKLIIKLKTRSFAARVQQILSQPPKRTMSPTVSRRKSQTPASYRPPSDNHFPSPTAPSPQAINGTITSSPVGASTTQAGWNMGGFRNYDMGPVQPPAPIKVEESDGFNGPPSAVSPMTAWPPASPKATTPTTEKAASRGPEDRAKPAKKLTLKLGMKKGGGQGSPT